MKKLSKILGVVVALTMLLSTFAFSTPVAADDEDWSLFTLPDIGAASDYFMDTVINGFGALAQATDGTLYLPVGGYADLFISTDDGRTWEETDFFADTGGGPIVDIACYSEDADTVYVADATNVYRTRDAGDSWTDLGDPRTGAATEVINCLDVGYADGDPHIFVGTNDPAGGLGATYGEVYYYCDAPFASVWTDLNVCAPDVPGVINTSEVWGIACSPDFENDTLVVAVINDGALGNAYVTANEGAGIGLTAWDDLELSDDTPAAFAITQATNPVFVEDFNIDDAYGLFVGVVGPAHAAVGGLGGVYQILGTDNTDDYLLDDVDADVASLDLVGDLDAASLLAGTQVAAGPASIWYSTDNGDSWDETDKPPTGTGATQNLVIVADDFADSGEAWCASRAATEGGIHLTTDFGATWNGISMLDTDMNLVAGTGAALDIAFTPGYSSDSGTMFAVTIDSVAALASVWSFDGDVWERILLDTANALDLVELSPEFASDNTLFVAASAAPVIVRSDDGGATFTALNREPAAAINSWLVVDDQTILVGEAAGVIEKTTRYGRRAWDDVSPTGAGLITDLAMSPNFATDGTILAGDAASLVFISTDEGEEWDELSASDVAGFTTADLDTYVCFDPNYASNNMVYAASDNVVARCELAADTDAGDQEFDNFADAGTRPVLTTGAGNGAGGIVASKDSATESTLYVLDGVAGAGMWRALDPFQDLGDITFENVVGTIGAAVDFSPNILKVSSIELTSGSNRIWAIDCAVAAADNVWEYTDNLAAPVALSSPTDGKKLEKTDWVNFQWTALADTVTNYVVEAFTEKDEPTDTAALTGTESVSTWDDINADGIIDPGEITWATVETVGVNTADTASYIWRDAEAGTTYYWRVQVTTPFLSRYSSSWSFMTKVGAPAAPVNVRPEPGASDVILRPTFGWLAIDGATIYKIIVASDPAFANVVASGDSAINVWALPADVADLAYSTTYYWKVWGEAASGAPAGDPVISAFTTAAEPAKPTPAVIVNPTPPAPPAPIITLEIPAAKTPPYVWAIIGIGGVLVIALVVLIARTRRVI